MTIQAPGLRDGPGGTEEKSMEIRDILPETELLAQLAEEAAELAQAALKLRRALDGTNPTPKSVSECREALREEYTDVVQCGNELNMVANEKQIPWKDQRWKQRLEEREQKVEDSLVETYGSWIYLDGDIQCSKCGRLAEKPWIVCPHCGVMMDMGVQPK